MEVKTMTYGKAKEVLSQYQKWRNQEKGSRPSHKEVDKALSVAIDTLETLAAGGIVETEEKRKLRRLYEFIIKETEE